MKRYLQKNLSCLKQLTNTSSKSITYLRNQFQELIIKEIRNMVKLLESSVQVMLSLPSVFQQLKLCQFESLGISIISLTKVTR